MSPRLEDLREGDDETCEISSVEAARMVSAERELASLVVLAGHSIGESFPISDGTFTIGRSRVADIKLVDEGISRAHARIIRDGEKVWLEDLDSRNGTIRNGSPVTGVVRLADGDKIQIGHGCILRFAFHDALDETFQRQMYQSSLRDPLTRVFNKMYLRDRIGRELRFAARHQGALSLLLVDLDHFKAINDTFGHLAGDRVLVAVAEALAQAVRTEDVLARYGGEEFVVLLRAIPLHGARITAERLRKLVEGLTVTLDDGRTVKVTASFGVAAFPEAKATTIDALIEAADRELYRAKAAGRNCVRG